MDTHATSTECGGSSCQCAPETSAVEASVPRINGIALHELGEAHDANTLRELAYSEILRQQAITLGLLPPQVGNVANPLTDAEREIVEAMVDQSIHIPEPTEEECQRYFDANKGKFVVGQELHLRHILFAVTPGVNVQALSGYAEKVLLELSGKNVPSDRFTQLAAELSNCPTGKEGGDLGWIGPQSCVSELSAELFHKQMVCGAWDCIHAWCIRGLVFISLTSWTVVLVCKRNTLKCANGLQHNFHCSHVPRRCTNI